MSRWEHEEVLERMAAQVATHPDNLVRRKTLIEHCWGTLKWLLPEGFLLKGLKKVGAEVSLAHFAYNFKRALKVAGLAKLLEVRAQGPRSAGTGKSNSALLRGQKLIKTMLNLWLGGQGMGQSAG